MAEKRTEVAQRQSGDVSRRDSSRWTNPFGLMERFADEIDRVFDDFGFGRSWISPRFGARESSLDMWAPNVDVFQRNNELIVRADLPGLNKEDVKVDVTD